jgi:hypothetical protein
VKQALSITKEEVVSEPEVPSETLENDSDGGVLTE